MKLEFSRVWLAAGMVLALRVAGAAAAYATQVYLARLLGAEAYGIFALVCVWTAVAGHLVPLGFSQTVCKFAPEYHVLGRMDLLRGYLSSGLAIVSALAVSLAAIAYLLLTALDQLLPELYRGPVLVALAILPVFALQEYLENVARAFNWPVLAILPPYLLRHGLTGIIAFLFAWQGLVLDPTTAMLATLGAIGFSVAIQLAFLAPRVAPLIAARASARELRQWIRLSRRLLFVDGTHILFSNIDVIVLGFLVSPGEIAVYFAATRILQLVGFVSYAVTAATAQRYSALGALKRLDDLKTLAQGSAWATFVVSGAAALGVLWTAPFLLGLFGADFSAGLPVVAILLAGLMLQAAAGPGEDLLNMLGHERACSLVFLLALIVNVIACIVLTLHFGMLGAAMAVAAATALRSLLLALLVRAKLGFGIILPIEPLRSAVA